MMTTSKLIRLNGRPVLRKQRGVVLFIALIALVTIMLAAVALTRSVDTTTVIAGNLAFKQAANASADAGLARAIAWMTQKQLDNAAKDPFADSTHAFNTTNAAAGYYSNVDDAGFDLTNEASWTDATSFDAGTDASDNRVRYVIQRMCRTANQVLTESDCQFSDSNPDSGPHRALSGTECCAQVTGKIPLVRITVRVAGPRNSVSYVQAFVY